MSDQLVKDFFVVDKIKETKQENNTYYNYFQKINQTVNVIKTGIVYYGYMNTVWTIGKVASYLIL